MMLRKDTHLFHVVCNLKGFIEFHIFNFYYLISKYRPKISFCTSVKNRFKYLEKTFIHNIENNISYPNCEFVLLNYNCPDPRTEEWVKTKLMPYIEQGKVNYYYYPDAELFDFAHSRNLSFRLAQGDILCNVDADNFLGRGFAKYVAMTFDFRGDLFLRCESYSGSSGRICVKRDQWMAVGGYDERFKSWGHEDIDLYNRLEMSGVTKRFVLFRDRFCRVITHSDEERSHHTIQDKSISSIEQRKILKQNIADRNICPNGSNFGHGRVLKNFSEWIEV